MSAQPLSPAETAIVARFDAAEPAPESWRGDVGLARRFHETYERLAPSFGYETRRESAVPWEDVPEQNRRLMVAVCEEVTAALRAKADAADRVRELLRVWTEVAQPQNWETKLYALRAVLNGHSPC